MLLGMWISNCLLAGSTIAANSLTCTWLLLDFNDCHCSKLQTITCAHLTFLLKLKPRWNITNTEISLCPDKNLAKISCEQNLKKLFNVTWSAYQTRSEKTLQGLQLTYKTNQSDKSAKNKNRWSNFFFLLLLLLRRLCLLWCSQRVSISDDLFHFKGCFHISDLGEVEKYLFWQTIGSSPNTNLVHQKHKARTVPSFWWEPCLQQANCFHELTERRINRNSA